MVKCQVGDTIRFDECGRIGIGIIEGMNPYSPHVYAVRVLHSERDVDVEWHHCEGFFEEPVGWNVWPDGVVEVIESADDSNVYTDVNPDKLMEILSNG